MITVRPKVAELVFQLYGRTLHPELFEIYNTRTIERGDFQASISITSAGHLITWRHRGLVLTEVAACSTQLLPQKRRVMNYRLKGSRHDKFKCRDGCKYQMAFSLETVAPEIFWTFQQELSIDGVRQGMLHKFDAAGRIAMGALSYINVEPRNRGLLIQAFHTFPDDYAIVKSQTLFELP